MGSTHSQPLQSTNSDIPVPHIDFDPPCFAPVASNVLVIETCRSMGGIRLGCALLYSPHKTVGGVAVDDHGRLCDVPEDRWKELEGVVRDAKKEWAVLGNHSSWSRPQIGSCPVSVYFDLGPSDDDKGLCTIQRTAHTVSTENLLTGVNSIRISVPKSRKILTYKKDDKGTYEETTVDKIPEPVAKLESELSKLKAELFPRSSGELESPLETDAKVMAVTVKNMSSSVALEQQLKKMYQASKKRSSWFAW
ncbi:hypothetical protein C8R45DRAFT_958795 [Mycena sanguinolenta]|nr:hypothetical protein C8R45DRAFT_958795 [Mycena sanguinolenta]